MLELKKELEPAEILNLALAKGMRDFYVGYSGGKDSGIVLDIVSQTCPENFKGVLFCDTGIGTIETKKFVIELCKEKNYPLHILKPGNVLLCETCHKTANRTKNFDNKLCPKCDKECTPISYEMLILRFGFPGASSHPATMGWLKWYPILQFIRKRIAAGEKPVILSGIRKKESARRNSKFDKWHDREDKIDFVKPIFYKDNNWVMRYFIENDIKRSPVYNTLHLSGDCLCGCFATREELKLIEMFHPTVFSEIKRLETLIKEKGTAKAKKYGKWGYFKQSTDDIQAQTKMENFVCNDCILDNKLMASDTSRFNEEMNEIDKKLEMVKTLG